MLKDDILNVFNFQQRCCLHIVITTDVKQWNTISAVTWRAVHEYKVADAFRSKKSSSVLLVHEQQASQKWSLSRRHLTACSDYKRNIYDTQSAQSQSHRSKMSIICYHEKMCPPGYHYYGFVATRALGHMMQIWLYDVSSADELFLKRNASATICS